MLFYNRNECCTRDHSGTSTSTTQVFFNFLNFSEFFWFFIIFSRFQYHCRASHAQLLQRPTRSPRLQHFDLDSSSPNSIYHTITTNGRASPSTAAAATTSTTTTLLENTWSRECSTRITSLKDVIRHDGHRLQLLDLWTTYTGKYNLNHNLRQMC